MSHIIGTVAIIAFATTLTIYLYSIGNSQSLAIKSSRLKTISDYVAVRVVQMISMVNMSNTQSCVQSLLELPGTVASESYYLMLIDQDGYAVKGAMVLYPSVTTESIIPLNSSSVNIRIVTQDGLIIDGLTVQSKIYGGATDTFVWARRIGNLIEIGFGRRS
jgi:hypothetical protein